MTKRMHIPFILIVVFFLGCKNDTKSNSDIKKKGNTLSSEIDFPLTVYTHKKYKGKIKFYNAMFDTIVVPRSDTTNFRFITYRPFKPYKNDDDLMLVYQDSVLLDNNTFDIELEFDEPGIYTIGGLAKDGLMMGYYTNGIRDSVRIIEHELVLFQKVIVKDSI